MPEIRSGRMDYLDHLRVFLTALVVCHHQSIAFGAPGGWYYKVTAPADIPSLVVMTMFVAVNQAFFMSLFFFVSAYFTRAALLKKSMPLFIRDRLIRLAIPLLVYYFLLNPSVGYLVRRFTGRTNDGYFAFMMHNGPDCFGWGPMWFVLTLILFTAAYLAISVRKKSGDAAGQIPLPGNRTIFVFILVTGTITFLVRLVYPTGTEFLGLQLGYFPMYICMFTFGILAHGSSWLDQLSKRQVNCWFNAAVVAILLLPVIAILGGAFTGNAGAFPGGLSWQALAYAVWEPFLCVGISMKLLLIFRERINRPTALTARLSKSSYTVYILHPFFVVVATWLAKDLPLPPLLIILIVCPLVLGVAFACSNVIRQVPLLNKVL
ncbi:MAG TPA: acyltransferase family protein [Candidatus Hydrogenedentes bacterium]|nr:acyltransferase family protein [Candidatus Hydrogenedentota bacterium]